MVGTRDLHGSAWCLAVLVSTASRLCLVLRSRDSVEVSPLSSDLGEIERPLPHVLADERITVYVDESSQSVAVGVARFRGIA